MIGWDEILKVASPPNASVMSWRGTRVELRQTNWDMMW